LKGGEKVSILSSRPFFIFLSFGLVIFFFVFPIFAADQQSQQSNYVLGRSVMGSGGILNSSNTSFVSHGTAGQAVVGGMTGNNNFLLSGFWHLPHYTPVNIQQISPLEVPTNFELFQNYPNPFNPETTIKYALPNLSNIAIEIFDVIGRPLRKVVVNNQEPGFFEFRWNGEDANGQSVGSGIFFYRLTVFDQGMDSKSSKEVYQKTKKMFLVK
jgi:hypothetical protein